MILFVIVFLNLFIFNMHAMDDEVSAPSSIISSVSDNSPYALGSLGRIPSSPEELGEFAIDRFCNLFETDVRNHVKPYVTHILQQESSSPDASDSANSDIAAIRRILSGSHIERQDSEDRLNRLVIKAMKNAFDEKEKQIEIKEARIKEKYSGKKTAFITAFTTIITTICGVIITWQSK